MARNEVILRFDKVSFEFGHHSPILDEVDFSVREGMKFTLMGQNGAGKTTIFQLITGSLTPESGKVIITNDASIAIARQVIPRDQMSLTVREFFEKCFDKKIYDIDPRIDEVLEVVNLNAPHERTVGSFSGGQQARLLLASALIQKPDLLLLDEPTNNLDKAGIAHLTQFLIDYKKTCIVISHDADFLNAFTHGVLYLDVFTRKMEQYSGDYKDVVAEISARIEKENRKNALLEKEIQANKDKVNFFAHKGGQMRLVAKKMREKVEEMEAAKVDVRKEDKTIRQFFIPSQPELIGEILNISTVSIFKDHKPTVKKVKISMKKNQHLLLVGRNGIGKSTLLEALTHKDNKGSTIAEDVRVGYYRQDFSTLNFEDTVYNSLASVADNVGEEQLRSAASGFLIDEDMMRQKIGSLSEGQKGLVAFAQLVLLRPGLLILDEPTNHINFRHIPIIANALNKYEGAMILVSHVPEFIEQIRIDETFDLEK
ncbi:MAG: ATP-binding cassette domain-containing protein [bacterium]|nr:ATP-binding cassette domain-containing protein [Candidatus Jorgensenbacteria bacterium]